MKISLATPRFARSICEIHKKTWLQHYPNMKYGINEDDIVAHFSPFSARIARMRNMLQNLEKTKKAFIAREGNHVVGFCVCSKHADHNELESIYVLPEYHGKGIGKKLFEEVKNFLGSELPMHLGVAIYNFQAISFYKKFGFKESDTKEQFHILRNGKKMPTITMILDEK